jgi:hypothetical protein
VKARYGWFANALIAVFSSLLFQSVIACSLVPCVNDGIEVNPNVSVRVKHEGNGLAGVTIDVIRSNPNAQRPVLSVLTGPDGIAGISDLEPGEYWLRAELLGIGAAYHCFHVAQHPSKHAKKLLRYEWGYGAPVVRRVAGTLVDTQPGTGGTPLWNLLHPLDAPISGAVLQLRNARTGELFMATSDSHGEFAFDLIPNGTYVLHSEGGRTGRPYDPTDLLIKIRSTGSTVALVLKRQDPSATNCGDSSLYFSWKKSPEFR